MDDTSSDALNALGKKLAAQREMNAPKPKKEEHISAAQAGWRMVTELVVGMLLGAAIGYGIDTFFQTLPIFLIIFSLLGFAAGVKAMMRSAEEIEKNNQALFK